MQIASRILGLSHTPPQWSAVPESSASEEPSKLGSLPLPRLPKPPVVQGMAYSLQLTATGLELNPQRHRGLRSFQERAVLPYINAFNNGPHLISSVKALHEDGGG